MGATYPTALMIHSWLRWAVLIALVLVVWRSWAGRRSGIWSALDEQLHSALVIATDVQFLVGIWLYAGASPFASAFLADIGAGVKQRGLRFFGMEHVALMIAAVAFIHVGRARSKKTSDGALRHRRVFAWTLVALVCVLAAIPWPFFPTPRPLFRFGF
jgi:hypothetical protein